MSLFSRGRVVAFLAVFVLNGAFLFVARIPVAQALYATSSYNKLFNDTLTAQNWNDLFSDFVNTWLPVSMNGPLGIATSAPVSGLEVNGPIKGSNFSGALTGSVSAANVSSGAFGSSLGGGNFSFPANVGIGLASPGALLNVRGAAGGNTIAEFTKTDTSGIVMRINDSNDANSFWSIEDGTSAAAFLPMFRGKYSGTNAPAFYLIGDTIVGSDTGSEPMVRISGRINNGTVTNRPLFDVANVNTPYFTIRANGNTGIGIAGPTKLFEVNGQAKFNNFAYGTTPSSADPLALTTVEYVEGRLISGGGPWSRTGTTTFLTNSGDNVAIGSTNALTKLQITANNDQLVDIEARNTLRFTDVDSSTTANQPIGKIEWYTSDTSAPGIRPVSYILSAAQGTSGGGNIRFGVSPNGGDGTITEPMVINGAGTVNITGALGLREANPVATRAINSALTTTNSSGYGIYNLLNVTGALTAGRTNYGLYNSVISTADNSLASNTLYGNYNQITNSDGTAFTAAIGAYNYVLNNDTTLTNPNAYGTYGLVVNAGTGAITSARGNYGYVRNDTGSMLNAYGTVGYVLQNNLEGTISNAYGGHFNVTQSGVGIITNAYGVYIDSISGGNTFGLYQAGVGNNNYFGGNLGIGATDPDARLTVAALNVSTPQIRLRSSRSAIGAGHVIGGIEMMSNDTNLTAPGTTTAGVIALAEATHTASVLTTGISFNTTNVLSYFEAMRIRGSGNVGIGTTNPTKLLEVNGQAKFNSFAYGTTPIATDTLALTTVEYVNAKTGGAGGVGSGTTGQTLRHDGTGWVGNSNLYNNGTNIGVGTTAPTSKLEISAVSPQLTISDTGNNYNANNIQATLYFNGRWFNGQSNPSADAYGDAAIRSFKDTSDGTGGSGLSFWSSGHGAGGLTEWMRINRYGNVGIGTTNPTQKLQVAGNILTTGDIRMDAGKALYAYDNVLGGTELTRILMYNGGDAGINIGTKHGSLGGIRFEAGSGAYTERMRITPQGNVGVGTTTPSKLLEVNGQAKFNSFAYGTTPSFTDPLAITTVEYVEGRLISGGGPWSKSGSSTFLTTNTDNVGIGITNPAAKLEVVGGSLFGGNVRLYNASRITIDKSTTSSAAGGGYFEFIHGTGVTVGITDNSDTNHLIFKTRPTDNIERERMRITSGGNVGIGTTGPGGTLSVKGQGGANTNIIQALNSNGITGFTIFEGNSNQVYLNLFNTSGTRNVLIDPSGNSYFNGGNVGIGTTAPGGRMQINSSIDNEDWLIFRGTSGSVAKDFSIRQMRAGTNSDFAIVGPSGEFLRVWDHVNSGAISGNLRVGSGSTPANALDVTGAATISGSLGIGTTNPTKLLEVNGQAKFNSFAYGTTPISTDTLALTTVEYVNAKTGGSGGVGAGTTGQTLRHDGTGWVGNSALYNNGTNVGIGTTAPSTALTVHGASHEVLTLQRTGSSSGWGVWTKFRLQNSSSAFVDYGYIGGGITSNAAGAHTGYLGFGTAQAGSLVETMRLSTAGNLQIDGALAADGTGNNYFQGNVGIGTTNPTAKLEVAGGAWSTGVSINTNSTSGADLKLNNYGAGGREYHITSTGSGNASGAGKLQFYDQTAALTRMVIDSSGNVGIGTTAGSYILDVRGAAASSGVVAQLYGTSNGALINFNRNGSYQWGAGIGASGTNGIPTSYFGITEGLNTPRLVIAHTSGNVGIGTTTPSKLLHVSGQGQFNSFAYGTTPSFTDPLALTTVEYVEGRMMSGGSPWSANSSSTFLTNNSHNVGIGTTAPQARLHLSGGLIMKRTTVADANYTVQADDYIIGYTSISANRTVTLPNALCTPGRFFVVLDESGNASASAKIIIDPEGTTPIIGMQTLPLEDSYNSVYVFCGNSAWYIL